MKNVRSVSRDCRTLWASCTICSLLVTYKYTFSFIDFKTMIIRIRRFYINLLDILRLNYIFSNAYIYLKSLFRELSRSADNDFMHQSLHRSIPITFRIWKLYGLNNGRKTYSKLSFRIIPFLCCFGYGMDQFYIICIEYIKYSFISYARYL